MDYMPIWDNGAYSPPTKFDPIRIRSFSIHVPKECISPDVSDETLLDYFPGRSFYGRFFDPASTDEIRQSLDVLRATRNTHELLQEWYELINEENAVFQRTASKILVILNDATGMDVKLGGG